MSFYKDLVACLVFEPSPYFDRLRNKTLVLSELVSRSMSTTSCNGAETESECRDQGEALRLKMVALGVILVAGVFGVALPLLGKKQRFLRTDGNVFVITKAFAAGVILATGFVHMLPDGSESLTDSCLPENPWSKFPFSSFIAMIAALCTLLVDFLATQFYEQKHEKEQVRDRQRENLPELLPESVVVIEAGANGRDNSGKGVGEEDGGGDHMHIVGMHAHAAAHRHSHPHGHHACGDSTHAHVNKHVGHAHTPFGSETESSHMRHAVVSQVLELGIVSHSVIIGLSLGVSQSPCTIRPLIAALSFHQFFEGFALGGCISQAQFKTFSASLMACFFAITTPAGIAVGTAVSSVYNPDSPRALVVEGVFDSISAGILIYMALVDLIAADFLSKRMSCNVRLQVASYFALFLGAGLMSALAIWA